MNIVYVYGRDWPSEKAGISFSTYTGYGIAAADKNNKINLIFAKNTNSDVNKILKDYFSIKPILNLKINLIDNKNFISKTTVFYIKAFKKIIKMHKEKKIDAVITRTVKFLPFLYILKKIYGIKVYFEAHSFYLDPDLKKEYDRKKEYFYQKIFLSKIDGIICHQSIIRDLYKKYLPKQRYKVINYGVRNIYRSSNIWEKNYLGYIGSLYENKGVKDLLYALTKVKDRNLKLLIVGGRSERVNVYLDLAKELGISDRVKITGWLKRSEVEKYLKKMKIGIVPVRDTFHGRYLTCPTKIFNYFSHGIPVIGSDLPTVKEVVSKECGIFFENGNVESLVESINYLNDSYDLFKDFSNNVFEKAEKLSFENRGKKFLDFIKET